MKAKIKQDAICGLENHMPSRFPFVELKLHDNGDMYVHSVDENIAFDVTKSEISGYYNCKPYNFLIFNEEDLIWESRV